MKPIATHPAWIAQTQATTIWGPVLLARSSQGLSGLWLDDQKHHPEPLNLPDEPEHPWFLTALAALADWPTRDAALPPLDPQGTAFQRRVWQLLRGIARGATTQYGTLAAQLGQPAASRAVGAAVGRNPIGILVPCHRVIGRDGSLTGYAGGLALKQRLLQAEGVL